MSLKDLLHENAAAVLTKHSKTARADLIDNCLMCTDGGHQEFSTAEECVKAVCPGSDIIENRVDKYPVRVIVTGEVSGKTTQIWSGDQRDLFSKYATKRAKSMKDIKANLVDFKESVMED